MSSRCLRSRCCGTHRIGNPISWQVWHIAEVEDNWVRALLYGEAKRYPFGRSVRLAAPDQYPEKAELLRYFVDTFNRIARAKKVQVELGAEKFDLEQRHLKKLFGLMNAMMQ